MSRKKIPYQFTNETQNGRRVVTLSGVIRKRYWDGDKCIDAKLLRDALDDAEEDIVIKLNSNGGDAFEGVEIYNYIKDHPKHVTVEVTGMAASAATFIVQGADLAVMNIGTVLMVHEAEMCAWGNKSELKKMLGALETVDQSIMDIYTNRTGQSEAQITEWMEGERWFTAEEAVKYGFADEIKGRQEPGDPDSPDLSDLVKMAVAQAMAEYWPAGKEKPPKGKQTSLINRLRKGD